MAKTHKRTIRHSPICDFVFRPWRIQPGNERQLERTPKSAWRSGEIWNRMAYKDGRPLMILCDGDPFAPQVSASWRADLFALIDATPNLVWILPTRHYRSAAMSGSVPKTKTWIPCAIINHLDKLQEVGVWLRELRRAGMTTAAWWMPRPGTSAEIVPEYTLPVWTSLFGSVAWLIAEPGTNEVDPKVRTGRVGLPGQIHLAVPCFSWSRIPEGRLFETGELARPTGWELIQMVEPEGWVEESPDEM